VATLCLYALLLLLSLLLLVWAAPRRKRRAGCVPLRIDPSGRLELMLITSRKHPEYFTFPAGGVEEKESTADAAVREVREEAGLVGRLGQRVSTADATHMFALWVEHELDAWPEQTERTRCWFDLGVPDSKQTAGRFSAARAKLSPKPSQHRVLAACERLVGALAREGESRETQWARPRRRAGGAD
jgi:8-oxo-dGTP pyrophosphatase MutT (NUDIX family)